MIIPKRDAKYYGAVHIDNYLTFTGFCKKVDSDEICDVDVFVDGKKIDTLEADKKIGKVEDIYDIEGHGFEFELSDEYFEKSHLLEFKASSGEELVNSKIQTIDKKHPKFNEYRFLHSLSNVDGEKIKDLYCKDVIGFLATEENLNDKDFVGYIKELYNRFPHVTFKAFYCNDLSKKLAQKVFEVEHDRLQCQFSSDINEIINNVEIYINYYGGKDVVLKYFPVLEILRKNCMEIFVIEYNSLYLNTKLYELDVLNRNHSIFAKKDCFTYTQKDYDKANGSIHSIIVNTIMSKIHDTEYMIDLNRTFSDIRLMFYVENALMYKEFKYYFFNLYQGELKSKQ
jgi:hypothetical protein